ncbi:hypothetical protein Rhopal_004898-T1 [Rhodotorula paludigena]|uniref:Uncharacterized protein n=1 Tax=Rhodotorula paludigena TaxID=86838 RepID=A0AAV5GNX4_9BASI|nr:hypothetical protein Rhopal_004898-T1 [Rhodotorula paludigena]
MAPRKRARSRSPSPQLPLHLLTSLPSSSSSSTLPPRSSDPSLARLPDALAHGVHAHEARLLDPREWTEWLGAREADEGRRTGVRWAGSGDETGEVYTDRYDILHLLPSLPPDTTTATPTATPAHPRSPSPGFSDLPSDHEELFYFSPAERIELERRKKRRRLEVEREERLRRVEEREREEREAEEAQVPDGVPSQSDDSTQLVLMQRLHATLSSSPNPSLLELRILANHGSDPRFAFLRPGPAAGAAGARWRGVWERIRRGEDVRLDEDGEVVVAVTVQEDGDTGAEDSAAQVELDEAERRKKQEMKAAKAREWAQRRKEARAVAERKSAV